MMHVPPKALRARRCREGRLLRSHYHRDPVAKDHIYNHVDIKFFSDGTASNLTVSTDNVINATINETSFPEPRRFFKNISRLQSKKDLSLNN